MHNFLAHRKESQRGRELDEEVVEGETSKHAALRRLYEDAMLVQESPSFPVVSVNGLVNLVRRSANNQRLVGVRYRAFSMPIAEILIHNI